MSSLLQIGITNALLATLIAGVVYAITRRWNYPVAAHLLWLLVLLKLFAPPLVSMPTPWHAAALSRLSLDAPPERTADDQSVPPQQLVPPAGELAGLPALTDAPPAAQPDQPVSGSANGVEPFAEPHVDSTQQPLQPLTRAWAGWILTGWLLGSGVVLVVLTKRILRFHRLLRATSPAPEPIQQLAEAVRLRLEVGPAAEVRLTSLSIPPVLWSLGRKKLIVLPVSLVGQLDEPALETVLAHELAHLKRRDHLVRWIELAAAILYWWLPTVWWVRSQLREAEEAACDAWVMAALPNRKHAYASALLQAVETLAGATSAAPAMASGLGEGRRLIRRIERLTHAQPPRLGRARMLAVTLVACIVLPVSIRAFAAVDEASPNEGRPTAAAEAVGARDQAPADETADAVPPDPLDVKRREAIQRGIDFLKTQQRAEGNWSDPIGFEGGMTALCTLALLEAGLPPNDPAVAKALSWLREHDKPERTYVVSLVTRVYAAAGLPEDHGRIKRNADWLASIMIQQGAYRGCWGYQEGALEGDNSNAQYAILGLEAAESAGVEVPEGIWHAAREYWLSAQNNDGSWGYKPSVSGTGSMTAAGITSLAIILSRADYTDRAAEREIAAHAVSEAFDWFAEHYSIEGNPVPAINRVWPRWHYYYLAALAHGCRYAQRNQIGDHDVFHELTQLLLQEQQQDGSWRGNAPEDEAQMATGIALLTLQIAHREQR